MEDLKDVLTQLRDNYDKRDDKLIENMQKSQDKGETISSIDLAKHNVYGRIVDDLDDILETYFE